MRDTAFDTEAIAADAIALAELPGGAGNEQVRIDWLQQRLAQAPGAAASTTPATWCGRSARGAGAEQLRAVLAEILERNR